MGKTYLQNSIRMDYNHVYLYYIHAITSPKVYGEGTTEVLFRKDDILWSGT